MSLISIRKIDLLSLWFLRDQAMASPRVQLGIDDSFVRIQQRTIHCQSRSRSIPKNTKSFPTGQGAQQRNGTETPGVATHSPSREWAKGLMRRYELSSRGRTSVRQPLQSGSAKKVASFRSVADEASSSVRPSSIENMTEVRVSFDLICGRTLAPRGSDSVEIDSTGLEKSNLTVKEEFEKKERETFSGERPKRVPLNHRLRAMPLD